MTISKICYLIARIILVLAAFGLAVGPVLLLPLGVAFIALGLLVG